MATQAELDALESAIAQGALSVQYQDRAVRYRSLDEMYRIRDQLRKDLDVGTSRQTRRFASHSKGLV